MSSIIYSTRKVSMTKEPAVRFHRNEVDLSDPRYTTTVHWHDFFELELVLSGKAIHLLNGRSYRVGPGSLYLLTPADLHTLLPDPEAETSQMTILNISFMDSVVSETSFVEVQTLPFPLTAEATGEDLESFFSLERHIQAARRAKGSHCDDILLHLFFVFIFKFLRLSRLQHETDRPVDADDAHQDKETAYIQKAIAYIRYNFRNPAISTATVAEAVYLSPNYFGTVFKKQIGMTCLSYIKKQRMNFAVVLLSSSSLTISEISEKCGYSSSPYFISDFHSTFGIPPKRYRELARENGSV